MNIPYGKRTFNYTHKATITLIISGIPKNYTS